MIISTSFVLTLDGLGPKLQTYIRDPLSVTPWQTMDSGAILRHPLDPLSADEIRTAISIVRASNRNVQFNVVSLHEPRKAAMTRWLDNRSAATKPSRVADVTVIAPGGKVGDGLVDLGTKSITQWQWVEGKQPIVSGPGVVA